MAEVLSYTVTAPNGDVLTLFVTGEGRGVCPVCGAAELDAPPWHPETKKPSYAFCPSCDNQIGWDDAVPPDAPPGTQMSRWQELREDWRKLAGDSDEVRTQLSYPE